MITKMPEHRNTHLIMPVLISRNVDASSLTLRYIKHDSTSRVSLAGEFDTPFSTKAAVVIYKDGRFQVVNYDRTAYRYVYKKKYFDATVDSAGDSVKHPLKYLTPISEVLPVGKVVN